MSKRMFGTLAFCSFVAAAPAQTEVVHAVRVADLLQPSPSAALGEGQIVDALYDDFGRVLEGLARVRVEGGAGVFAFDHRQGGDDPLHWRVLVKTPAGAPVRGELWLPTRLKRHGTDHLQRVSFTLPADAPLATSEDFDHAVQRHAAYLASLGIAGKPLFEAMAEGAPPDAADLPRTTRSWMADRPIGSSEDFDRNDFSSTFELFTGGRALQENLQVDRMRTLDPKGDATIDVGSIEGITIAGVDWKKRIGEAKPEIEPLATWVPADQLYVGFESFAGMVHLLDEMEQRGDTLIHAIEPRSEDAGTRARLERQIGISTSLFGRLLGPAVVRSVAFTASDPYLREGTDVAVLFDCTVTEPIVLRLALGWKEARAAVPGCVDVEDEHGGVKLHGLVSPDRRVSSYYAVAGDVALVSNSRPGLERLIDAHAGRVAALGTSDEHRFFRSRYAFHAGGTKALLELSDPFLRRLCGPACRIGESRRLRCAAVQARLEGLRAAGATDDAQALAEKHELACPCGANARYDFVDGGARCSVHGGAGFLTPIAEVPVTRVSEAEQKAYEQFRSRYEQYWRQYFDPIALELDVGDPITFDLTVLPLINDTAYAQLRDFASGDGALTPQHGDAHAGTLMHFIAHVNLNSQAMQQAGEFAKTLPGLNVKGFGWLGDSVELFVENSPFWDGLAQAMSEEGDADHYFQQHLAELPFGLSVAIKNPLTFAGFVMALRAFAESSLPNQLAWETREHEGLSYVVVKPKPGADFGEEMASMQLCYGGSGPRFWVTMNETLMQHALERAAQRTNALLPEDERDPKIAAPPAPMPWLGQHVSATLDVARLRGLLAMFGKQLGEPQEVACFANLPVLEEWRRREPTLDPIEAHARHFGVRPICPEGGTYVWDAELDAMTCSKHGHPTAPRTKGEIPPALAGIARLAAGITFEEDGVRVRLEAAREK